jgi:U4/U6.U5 tri-snRNP-associated protein 1
MVSFSEEESRARELAKIRQKLKLGNMETLDTPQLRVASDYFNDDEMAAFKKPKAKKKKIRKKILKVQ